MRVIEKEVLRIIIQSGYYSFFEIVFVIGVLAFFSLLFSLALKEFMLFLSLAKVVVFAYSEKLTVLSQSQRSDVGLKEVA